MEKPNSKIVMDGLLEVFPDGRIFRFRSDGGKVAVPITRTGSFSVMVLGKQKHYYARRVIAEAYIPNPENKPYVSNIDGNPRNNAVENLMWTSKSEQVKKMVQTRKTICTICGKETCSKDRICGECKAREKALDKIKENAAARRERIDKEMESADMQLLTPLERQTVELRQKYLTYDEIAAIMGCTRQCIEQRLRRVRKKNEIGYKPRKMQINKTTSLKNRIARARCEKECLLNQLNDVQREISFLEKELSYLTGENKETPVAGTARESR